MVIVDPMHCLFLGLTDWQFHEIWVNMKHLREGKDKETEELQKMVATVVRPRQCGRPPAALGTSAAGSLTSDPLRSLVTIDFPLAIPLIWDTVDINSVEQRAHEVWAKKKEALEKKKAEALKGDKTTRKATVARQRAEAAAEAAAEASAPPRKRARKSKSGPLVSDLGEATDDELPPDAQMLENAARLEEEDARERGLLSWRLQDAEGILLLSSAIKRLCTRTVTREAIRLGHEDLMAYLKQTAKLRGAERIRPNHHLATHIANQINLYGPPAQIWTYSGERLNYTLKNTNNNRHRGGEREMSFAKTFHRNRECINRLSRMASNEADPLTDWAVYMLQLDHDDLRGTIGAEALSRHTNSTNDTPQQKKPVKLQPDLQDALYKGFSRAQPDHIIRRAAYEHGDEPVLVPEVYPIREVVQNGRVFSMASFRDSIVKAGVVENGVLVERVGEIVDLWEHKQPVPDGPKVSNTFARVRWYKASTVWAPRSARLWSEKFPQLDIEWHVPEEYMEKHAVIPVSDIRCHCARMTGMLAGEQVWLTIGLERE
ncbi:hypothetical protein FRC09_012243 [Ceratobasidium sp. 395]|nr:hypothetical protein FRC09_012243 [Ceratobasidium sp. 395]